MIARNIFVFAILIVLSVGGFMLWAKTNLSATNQDFLQKEYNAEKGYVVVVDEKGKRKLTRIDLSAKEDDFIIQFTPHQIRTFSDSNKVWLTASASEKQLSAINKNSKEHLHLLTATDQVIVIDPKTNKITKRIPIGVRLGLSDFVFAPDGKFFYIAAEMGNAIYKVNTTTFKVEDLIQLPPESKPHQLAVSMDGKQLFMRDQKHAKLYRVLISTNKVEEVEDAEIAKNLNWSKH